MKNILFFVLCFLLLGASLAKSSDSTLEAHPLRWGGLIRHIANKIHKQTPVRRAPVVVNRAPVLRRAPVVNKRAPVTPKLSNFCSAWGDPHFTSFSQKKYDNYRVGDFVLAQTEKFTVHSRQRPWHRAAVNTRIVVKPNLGRTKFELQSISKQILNGNELNMKIGQIIKFKAGGYVHRHTISNFKIVGVAGDYIDLRVNTGRGWPQSHYIDFLLFLKNPYEAKGLCVAPDQQISAHGLFHSFVPMKKLKPFVIKEDKLKKAEKMCKKFNVPKKFLKQCATDIILSDFKISPSFFKKFLSLEKKDEKKFKKAEQKKKLVVHTRKVHHFCRASGDPHFVSFFNERFDNYQTGDFVLAKTKHFEVHSRQRPWGRAAVNVRIAVRPNKKSIFEVQSTTKQILNGNPINMKIGQKIKFKRGGYVLRKSKSGFKVEGMTGDYIDMNINEGRNWPQQHYIDFIMMLQNPRKSKGLCSSSKQKISAHGLFHRFVAPKKRKPVKYSKKLFKKAMKICKKAGINKKNRKQCAIDLLLSDFKISPKATKKILKLAKKDKKKYRKIHPKIIKKIIKKLKRRRAIKKIKRRRAQKKRQNKRRARKNRRRQNKRLLKKLKKSKRFQKLSRKDKKKLIKKFKRYQKVQKLKRRRALKKRRQNKKARKQRKRQNRRARKNRRRQNKRSRRQNKRSRKQRKQQRKARREMRKAKRLQKKLARKARRIERRQRRKQRRLERKIKKAQKLAKRRPVNKLLKRRRIPSKINKIIKFVEAKGISLKHILKRKLFKKLSRKFQKMIIRKIQRDRKRLGRYIKVRKYIRNLRASYEVKLQRVIAALRKECAKKLEQALSSRREMKLVLRRKIKQDLLASDAFAGRLSNIVKREVIRQVGRKGCCSKNKKSRDYKDEEDDEDCDE